MLFHQPVDVFFPSIFTSSLGICFVSASVPCSPSNLAFQYHATTIHSHGLPLYMQPNSQHLHHVYAAFLSLRRLRFTLLHKVNFLSHQLRYLILHYPLALAPIYQEPCHHFLNGLMSSDIFYRKSKHSTAWSKYPICLVSFFGSFFLSVTIPIPTYTQLLFSLSLVSLLHTAKVLRLIPFTHYIHTHTHTISFFFPFSGWREGLARKLKSPKQPQNPARLIKCLRFQFIYVFFSRVNIFGRYLFLSSIV